MRLKLPALLKETAVQWYGHNVFLMSAALAYYTVFSLAPLLIVVLFVVGLFWKGSSSMMQDRILGEIQTLIGKDGATMVGTMLEGARQTESGGVPATVLGLGALLFGATAVFAQLKVVLNEIWDVTPDPAGVLDYLKNRLLSLGLIIVVGFLLLVSLLVSAFLAAVDGYLAALWPEWSVITWLGNFVLSIALVTALFAMIYRYLPDLQIAWRDVWVGGFITSLLFTLGKFGIGLYLGNAGAASAYGAAGSFAVLLLWVYYSALIVFFGAEFTHVYSRHYGTLSRREPPPESDEGPPASSG